MNRKLASLLIAVFTACVPVGFASSCETDAVTRNDAGLALRVAGARSDVAATTLPGGGEVAFMIEPLAPYVVLCEEDAAYRIAHLSNAVETTSGRTGYVAKGDVFPWPTVEAVRFRLDDDPTARLPAWLEAKSARNFLLADNKANPPSFRESRQSFLRRPPMDRPYPVLSAMVDNGLPVRLLHVMLPAEPSDRAKVVFDGEATALRPRVTAAMTRSTFVAVLDATASSLGPFGEDLAKEIHAAFAALPAEVQFAARVGYVFFRDEDDDEKIAVVDPLDLAAAIGTLREASSMDSGGGDSAEPVLDAVYVGAILFPWSAGRDDGIAGRRALVVSLFDDAKPETTGKIDERVPAGLSPDQILANLLHLGISSIVMQPGPDNGATLVAVLAKIAESGVLIRAGREADIRGVPALAAAHMARMARETFEQGTEVLSRMGTDVDGHLTLPRSSLDGEMLDRLARAGLRFRVVDPDRSARLKDGYVLDTGSLEPVFLAGKATIEKMVELFAALAVAGVDRDGLIAAAELETRAILGEEYERTAPPTALANRVAEIPFLPELAATDLAGYETLSPDIRVRLAKRVQDSGDRLSEFLTANVHAFDSTPAIWVPVDLLP